MMVMMTMSVVEMEMMMVERGHSGHSGHGNFLHGKSSGRHGQSGDHRDEGVEDEVFHYDVGCWAGCSAGGLFS